MPFDLQFEFVEERKGKIVALRWRSTLKSEADVVRRI